MSALRLARIARPVPVRSCAAQLRGVSNKPALKPLPAPPHMPQESYVGAAEHTFTVLGRSVKYLFFGVAGLGLAAYLGFEGTHMYVERVGMASPSRSTSTDEYAWADENQAWTGGLKGGTDPRLGWKGRHALRGAWIAWEWGASDNAVADRHPQMRGSGKFVDKGYELAEEYIDMAIEKAKAKGMVFPPVGVWPPVLQEGEGTPLDLLMLKAGVLERIGTVESLDHAREIYQRVLAGSGGAGPAQEAKVIRLAGKIGDLAQRSGEDREAVKWWSWGLGRAGIELPTVEAKKSSWWSSSKATPVTSTPPSTLAPPVLRAATSILISASAAEAQKNTKASLASAAAIQSYALSLLPPKPPSTPTASDAPAVLQNAWIQSRNALLTLHSSSVAHAQKDKSRPLDLSTTAAERADSVLHILTPTIPPSLSGNSNPCTQPTKRLLRDTLMTAAEAYFTRAALLERSAGKGRGEDSLHKLEHAAECYQRAMSLSAAESGQTKDQPKEDGVGRSPEWVRYWRGYVRVRDRMISAAEGK